jgi:hypothetical protein
LQLRTDATVRSNDKPEEIHMKTLTNLVLATALLAGTALPTFAQTSGTGGSGSDSTGQTETGGSQSGSDAGGDTNTAASPGGAAEGDDSSSATGRGDSAPTGEEDTQTCPNGEKKPANATC